MNSDNGSAQLIGDWYCLNYSSKDFVDDNLTYNSISFL